MKNISVSFGEGKYKIDGMAVFCGKDLNLAFTGGTLPHIGAVSLAVYEPVRDSATVSTVAVYTHRDGELSAKGAKEASGVLKCTVTVTVGIHVDDAGPEDLDILMKNFEQCHRRLLCEIKSV